MSLIRENDINSMQRSLLLFENSIHSEATRYQYRKGMAQFMRSVDFQDQYYEKQLQFTDMKL